MLSICVMNLLWMMIGLEIRCEFAHAMNIIILVKRNCLLKESKITFVPLVVLVFWSLDSNSLFHTLGTLYDLDAFYVFGNANL